jgi:hypothetical protein
MFSNAGPLYVPGRPAGQPSQPVHDVFVQVIVDSALAGIRSP